MFVPAFKARTNLCITHSKWGHFFTHLWTCLARTKRGLRPYPPTPILWQREDSAHSHKARTEILTSLCQNVLTLNVKNWFWSSLWMPGRTHTHTHTHTHNTILSFQLLGVLILRYEQWFQLGVNSVKKSYIQNIIWNWSYITKTSWPWNVIPW